MVTVGGAIRGTQVVDRYAEPAPAISARGFLPTNANARVGVALSVILLALLGVVHMVQLRDAKASKDHPLVARYAGAVILGYEQRNVDEYILPLGQATRSDTIAMTFEAKQHQRVEGKLTRILYVVPAMRSSLEGLRHHDSIVRRPRSSVEVLQHYRQVLTAAGFQTLYTCAGQACAPQPGGLKRFLVNQQRPVPSGDVSTGAFQVPQNERYLAARLSRPEGEVYASVYVAIEASSAMKETASRPLVLLEVIETKPAQPRRSPPSPMSEWLPRNEASGHGATKCESVVVEALDVHVAARQMRRDDV